MRFFTGSAQLCVLNAPPCPKELGESTLLAGMLDGSSTTEKPSPHGIPGSRAEIPGLLPSHLFEGLRPEDAFPVEGAAVQHHLIELRNVLRG